MRAGAGRWVLGGFRMFYRYGDDGGKGGDYFAALLRNLRRCHCEERFLLRGSLPLREEIASLRKLRSNDTQQSFFLFEQLPTRCGNTRNDIPTILEMNP